MRLKFSPKERLRRFWKALRKGAAEALFPDGLSCVSCGAELRPDEKRICARCAPYFAPIDGALCPKCGAKLFENGACPDCRGAGFRFRTLKSAYPYEGKVKTLVLDRKDGGKGWLSRWFAEVLADSILASGGRYDALLFPPSSKKTIRKRGFDHMKLVAKRVSELTEIPAVPIFSKNEASGEKQAKKDRAARVESAAEAYSLSKVPEGKRFALLDDVATTCATLDALSALLKTAVPDAEIDCYTFARTFLKNKE